MQRAAVAASKRGGLSPLSPPRSHRPPCGALTSLFCRYLKYHLIKPRPFLPPPLSPAALLCHFFPLSSFYLNLIFNLSDVLVICHSVGLGGYGRVEGSRLIGQARGLCCRGMTFQLCVQSNCRARLWKGGVGCLVVRVRERALP